MLIGMTFIPKRKRMVDIGACAHLYVVAQLNSLLLKKDLFLNEQSP